MPFYSYESIAAYSNNKERYYVQNVHPKKKRVELAPPPKEKSLRKAIEKAGLIIIAQGGKWFLVSILYLPHLLFCRAPRWAGRKIRGLGLIIAKLGLFLKKALIRLKNKMIAKIQQIYQMFIRPFILLKEAYLRLKKAIQVRIQRTIALILLPFRALGRGVRAVGHAVSQKFEKPRRVLKKVAQNLDKLMRALRKLPKTLDELRLTLEDLVLKKLRQTMDMCESFEKRIMAKVSRVVKAWHAFEKRIFAKVDKQVEKVKNYLKKFFRPLFSIKIPKFSIKLKPIRFKLPKLNMNFAWLGYYIRVISRRFHFPKINLTPRLPLLKMPRRVKSFKMLIKNGITFLKRAINNRLTLINREIKSRVAKIGRAVMIPIHLIGNAISFIFRKLHNKYTNAASKVSLLFAYWKEQVRIILTSD